MARILSIPERIRLFKEINRVHKKTYGWRMLYRNEWGKVSYIDIDRDAIEGFDEWVQADRDSIIYHCFHDSRGSTITALRGLFSWQAYYFYHVNPYNVLDLHHKLNEENFISDNFGKRLKPDVDSIKEGVECLETRLVVQQNVRDGKIWISTPWLYHEDCYSSVSPFGDVVYDTIDKAAGGDKRLFDKLWKRYERINEENINSFKLELQRYFKGNKLKGRCWDGGYLFAASRNWIIKTMEHLNEALEVEDEHFSIVSEEFVEWFRKNGVNLCGNAKQLLRQRVKKLYEAYPKGKVKQLCEYLVNEDKVQPSDVYLWWGSEPESLPCYALLTLFFEIDPDDINTSKLEDRVSRNLPTLINIAEKENVFLSHYREYKPHIWKAIFL